MERHGGTALAQDGPGSVPVSPEPADDSEISGLRVGIESLADGFVAPLMLTGPDDGSGRRFVVDQVGQIRIVDAGGNLLGEPFLDIGDRILELNTGYDERGLLGLAFHPEYADNGRFFIYYSAEREDDAPANWDHTAYLAEFRVGDDPDVADPGSEREIMRIDQPFNNHNGGQIRFGHDGMLYIPLGDGGNGGDIDPDDDDRGRPDLGNAQTTSSLLGKVLRIDINSDGEEPYAVPPDNPFVDDDDFAPEIFAYGLRNPYGLTVDRETGDLYAAEAGQALFEEMTRIEPGGNHGWNIREGFACFDTGNFNEPLPECAATGYLDEPLVDPVVAYRRSPDDGSVVIPGVMYRGDNIPALKDRLVFGDYARIRFLPEGVLYAAEPAAEVPWPMGEVEVTGDIDGHDDGLLNRFLLGVSQDADGELYLLTTENGGPEGTTGEVFAVVAAGEPGIDRSTARTWIGIGAGVVVVVFLVGAALGLMGRRRNRRGGGDP